MRSLFPVLNSSVYLNTAYVGLMSKELFSYRKKIDSDFLNDGDKFKIDSLEKINKYRETISSFINSKIENTFFTVNFSTGYRYVLDMIPNNASVLTIKDDYESLINGLKERDFEIDYVEISPNFEIEIEKQLKKKSYSVLAVSVVQFLSGIKIDFEKLNEIKTKNPNLIIIGDTTQFVGSDFFDFDSSPFDVVIGSGYKWLLAGFGNAYISFSNNFFLKTNSSAELIYEKVYSGHINYTGAASLNFAINFLQKNNFNSLIKRKKELSSLLKDELDELGLINPLVKKRKLHSGIYNIPGQDNLHKKLTENGIRFAIRGEGIRVSVHFYNNISDIEKLIKVLKN
jgi:cysteine desulfurase/selenocysteine lyase|tara:strand:+ start:2358 stop:3383 length:1026 start_codon:yes stop_codon:yes gene_type:complete